MEFKIGQSTIFLEDKDLDCLTDVGLEFDIELTFDQVCQIASSDHNFIFEAAKWGVGDTCVGEGFMDAISNFFVGIDYPGYPATKEDQSVFKQKVKDVAKSRGFKVIN